MSKMREALRAAYTDGEHAGANDVGYNPAPSPTMDQALDEIAQRYGDLEFTREEVRHMLTKAYRDGAGNPNLQGWGHAVEEILSRHLGESESGEGRVGYTVTDGEKSEFVPISNIEKRIAAIEQALLARGHTSSCMHWRAECTCGYDKIRESRK